MKQRLMPRWLTIKLTGVLFAAYSAYNVFIIFRDGSKLPSEGIFISALVAVLFGVLAGYALTFSVKKKNFLFLMIRRTSFIIAMLAIFALKLRMADRVAAFLQPEDLYSDVELYAVLYVVSYFLTLAAMLLLLVYYIFIRRKYVLYPKASVRLPSAAVILFLSSLILEVILFFAYGIGLEANTLRTVVMRPVFYLGFIGLSVYYLFEPQSAAAQSATPSSNTSDSATSESETSQSATQESETSESATPESETSESAT